ncbi:hypothetical protein D0Z07_7348 [Hyphodiscus hymeniophilus]|uniref:Uncharacterized protein n=1 Tax=Hyphodiscus hymeniophilus TaxID=353542 RepID=A0A9P6VEN0_9HELO|nr:hypothetical protein D0Z07_7348 [Hyphodiscus hymeniophilus]
MDNDHGQALNGLIMPMEVTEPHCFLDFPREIRDLIYAMIFISKEPIYPSRDRAPVAPYMSFLRANKQIYTEILPFLYGKNTFQIRGTPAFKSPAFLNFLHSQRQGGYLPHPPSRPTICLARHHLRRLNIPSHGIQLDHLRHLFSLMRHFPNLEHIQLVYLGKRGLVDMDVVDVCRLLKDRLPLLNITLLKRVNFGEAEDISWTLHRPYYKWMPSSEKSATEHWWICPNFPDLDQYAPLVSAPQKIPE